MLQGRIKKMVVGILPAVIAAVVVLLERYVTTWAHQRESVLPVTMLLLFAAMLHPPLRRLLVVTLCYGVGFLALRDALHTQMLPPGFDYDVIADARPIVLLMVAALAAFAAILETARPDTVLARRCYFGAAALYFSGIGVINFAWHRSWQSLLLCITGGIALVACVFAPRMVAEEEAETQEAEEASDEVMQQEREAAHLRALRAKEWKDTLGMTEPASNDRDNGSLGPSPAPQ